ncbi:O-unit flippase-like protein [Vibrio splendidus]
MIKSASKKDVIWGYLAQFLNIGSGIIIIPVAIKYLTTEELGLWYLFIAIAGLAQLLEFGFQPTISRMISYVYSGAKYLLPTGIPEMGKDINYQLLYDLISASKKIYRYISITTAVFLLTIGTYYLNTFQEFEVNQLIAWVVFSSSTIINFYFSYLNGIIIGKGEQLVLYRIVSFSKLLMLMVSVPLLVLNYGLMSMAIGTFVSLLITRLLLYKQLNDKQKLDVNRLSLIDKVSLSQVKIVWKAAWKLGLTSLGAFLILRANQFIASSYLGLQVAASYGLTIQIISVLSSVSAMYFTLNLPRINALQSLKDRVKIKPLVKKTFVVVYLLYFLGSLGLVLIGVPILKYLSSNTELVSLNLLVLMLFMYGLELNHSISATYLTTLNKVPFVYSALISGICIVFLSLIIVNFSTIGLLGLVCAQFIIQFAYNNWYWPLQTWKNLRNDN